MGTASNQPPGGAESGPAAAGTGAPPASTGTPAEAYSLGPGEAEVDTWAERERQCRAGWLSGPSADERAAWTQRERERRLGRAAAAPRAGASGLSGLGDRGQRAVREAQLAAEGALSLLWKWVEAEGPVGFPVGLFRQWSRHGLDVLVQAGREWEADQDQPRRGRRVSLPEDGEAP
jgi:hypothetical protein